MKRLTRQEFKDWLSGKLKVITDGVNINPSLGFNPLPSAAPRSPPKAKP